MHARKLMLTVLAGGPILGTLAGLAVDPTLKPPPEPFWRQIEPDVIFTQASHQFAEAPPVDLDPPRWLPYRRAGFVERFAGFPPEEQRFHAEAPAEPVADAIYLPLEPASDDPVPQSPAAIAPTRAAMAADRAAAVAQQVTVAQAEVAAHDLPEPSPDEGLPEDNAAPAF